MCALGAGSSIGARSSRELTLGRHAIPAEGELDWIHAEGGGPLPSVRPGVVQAREERVRPVCVGGGDRLLPRPPHPVATGREE